MSARGFFQEISEFGAALLEQGAALSVRPHKIVNQGSGIDEVTWIASEDEAPTRGEELRLSEYLRCLRCSDYSMLLEDGGVIQISISMRGEEILSNRFCYIPCPVYFDQDELRVGDEIYPVEDFILDLDTEELRSRMCIRPPFRFELDPDNHREDHPLSHVHLGMSSSRLPVSASMCWDSFARFVFKNFYPTIFETIAYRLRFPAPYRQRTIESQELEELHFNFQCHRTT